MKYVKLLMQVLIDRLSVSSLLNGSPALFSLRFKSASFFRKQAERCFSLRLDRQLDPLPYQDLG